YSFYYFFFFFFFQAEDGIRDGHVTGVQTCALPIWVGRDSLHDERLRSDSRLTALYGSARSAAFDADRGRSVPGGAAARRCATARSEERRVGKECRDRGSA